MEEGEIISGPRSHNLEYDAGYKEIFKDLEKLYFSESDISAAETGLFAMTIGIGLNKRVERTDWKGSESWSNTNRLPGYGYGDFLVLLETLNRLEEGKEYWQMMNEYATGGLEYINDKMIYEEGNLEELKSDMQELFASDVDDQ